ncbi:nucleotide exchange factor GrpE [Legionella lytica]|uniref:Protein GrpE n=1 Tax=Legionella lytica TaxID=96232 RepID=A0ABY4Y6U5_9GAMM|nr:nucleotide exchange factor GrpE [Legionella lytica]USQ13363.1 nucleotide exchange factor GrpE [Legionella lytica]
MSKHEKKDWNKFKEEHQAHEEQPTEEQSDVAEPVYHEEGLEHANYKELSEQLTLAEQKAHENWEKSVRAMAELDNVRRRAEREIANAHRYGAEKLVSALLPIIDSLEQALQLAAKAEDTAMREGLELTMKLFVDVLQKFDVQQLDPMGMPFDPQEHEAMTMQDAPDVAPNTVIAVFQKGYKLNDRVIRPARVIVSKK